MTTIFFFDLKSVFQINGSPNTFDRVSRLSIAHDSQITYCLYRLELISKTSVELVKPIVIYTDLTKKI